MANKKTGSFWPCEVCGKDIWRIPDHVRRGVRRTCSRACQSIRFSGEGNPFWGKNHSPEIREKIKAARRANPPKKKTGPKPGWGHTPETRAAMAVRMVERWKTNRDKMIAALPRGEDHHQKNINPEPRYRRQFTPLQRRDWKADNCAYCGTTDDLTIDHVIPVMAGGKNERTNAQTLCQPCNLWKMGHIDKAILLAILGSESG
jgi:5-methylcytosine-specific restriction endonuclease McrA